MNLVLAFDTATETLAIGLGRAESSGSISAQATYDLLAPRAAMSRLLPAAVQLLEHEGLRVDDLSAIVVGRGPGSFTGIRIAVATAKGLAQGLSVPLYGVGTLDAVAWRFSEHEGLLGVLGDAMRGEVYPALFRCEKGLVQRLSQDRVCHPAEIAQEWAGLDAQLLLTGTALAKYRSDFEDALGTRAHLAEPEMWSPSGAGLLAAFEQILKSGGESGGDVGALLPVYTRLADAEEAELTPQGVGTTPPATGVRGPSQGGSGTATGGDA